MTKIISLSDNAYKSLRSLKEGKDSFSDVVLKLVQKEKMKSLLDFAGIWKNLPEMDAIFKEVTGERHKTSDRKIDLKW